MVTTPKGPRYREILPSACLSEYVECYWTLRTNDPTEQRVLPDGCVDLLVDRLRPGGPEPKIVGAMRRAAAFHATAPRDLVAVRFAPGGARALLQLPVAELTDTAAPLHPSMGAPADEARRCLSLPPDSGALRRLDALLLARLTEVTAKDRRGANYARACLRAGDTSVADLSRQLGVSRQHLRRQVLAAGGIGPKALARIGRLRKLIGTLGNGRPLDAEAAVDAGYCDQPHMINEFRSLTGTTPAAYVRALTPVPFVQDAAGVGS